MTAARIPDERYSARLGSQRSPMRKPEAAFLMDWFYELPPYLDGFLPVGGSGSLYEYIGILKFRLHPSGDCVKKAIFVPKSRWFILPGVGRIGYFRLGIAGLLLTSLGCTPPPPRNTHDADVRSITEAEVLWVTHWRLRDAERIVSHYSEDASMSLPNVGPAVGRESIKEMVKEIVRDGSLAFNFDAARVEVAQSGDYGYVQGTYSLTMTDLATKKAATDEGTYLRVYRKQLDGGWRVLQDMRASKLAGAVATSAQ